MMPQIDVNCKNLRKDSTIKVKDLKDYPRLKQAFLVGDKSFDINNDEEKRNLVMHIRDNINNYDMGYNG